MAMQIMLTAKERSSELLFNHEGKYFPSFGACTKVYGLG